MKNTHHNNIYTWAQFDPERNIDFNSFFLVGPNKNIIIDPLPLTDHDREHLRKLGGVQWIVVTNSDHIRDTEAITTSMGAKIAAPKQEKHSFTIHADKWIGEGDDLFQDLQIFELEGSKTPGELTFLFEGKTLITSDLIRGQKGGALNLLPDKKIKDHKQAVKSISRFLDFKNIDTVLVGDGWHIFNQGYEHLKKLCEL